MAKKSEVTKTAEQIAALLPDVSPHRLTTKIFNRHKFGIYGNDAQAYNLAAKIDTAPRYTVLSAIRRFRAKQTVAA